MLRAYNIHISSSYMYDVIQTYVISRARVSHYKTLYDFSMHYVNINGKDVVLPGQLLITHSSSSFKYPIHVLPPC